MADLSPPKSGGLNLQKKVGPLPVWAWAVIGLAVGYYLYKHYQSSTAASTGSTIPATDTTPVPVGDQSGSGGGASGSSGTSTPADISTPTNKVPAPPGISLQGYPTTSFSSLAGEGLPGQTTGGGFVPTNNQVGIVRVPSPIPKAV